MHEKQPEKTIDEYTIDVARKNHPKTVKELAKLVQPKYPIPEEEILECMLNLQNQGKLALKNHEDPIIPVLRSYIFSSKSTLYWTIMAVAAATMHACRIVTRISAKETNHFLDSSSPFWEGRLGYTLHGIDS